jgi:hypothetical protein
VGPCNSIAFIFWRPKFTKIIHGMAQKSLGTKGSMLSDLYWHRTYIYRLFWVLSDCFHSTLTHCRRLSMTLAGTFWQRWQLSYVRWSWYTSSASGFCGILYSCICSVPGRAHYVWSYKFQSVCCENCTDRKSTASADCRNFGVEADGFWRVVLKSRYVLFVPIGITEDFYCF